MFNVFVVVFIALYIYMSPIYYSAQSNIGIYEAEAEFTKRKAGNRNLRNGVFSLSLGTTIFKMKSVQRAFEEYAI